MQGAQELASSLHWKLAPDSLAEKAKPASLALEVPEGPESIEVSGAVVSGGGGGTSSTVQLWVAGLGSTFPAASVARTENWWGPRTRLE